MSDEQATSKLTPKQRKFVDAYFACNFNATQAAKDAGYSEASAYSIGWENLKKPEIAAEVSRRMAELVMPADEVLARLSDIARGTSDDFLTISEVGWKIDLDKAKKAGKLHLVKKLRATQFGPAIELHDPITALQLIGKQHGLFKDDGILKYLDLSKLNDEQLERLAAGEDPVAVLLNK